MFADPQVKDTGIAQPLDHPKLGRVEVLGQAIGPSRTPARMRRAPAELGEHTDEVLAEVGFDAEAILQLRRDGVI